MNRKKGKIKRAVIAFFVTIAAFIITSTAAWFILIGPPKVERGPFTSESPDGQMPAVSLRPGGGSDYYEYRDKVYTFLLCGTFEDGNTDTIMVGTMDIAAQTLNVVSIQRDVVVNADRRVKKINAAYSSGGSGEKGMENLRREVSTLVGFVPDFYVMIKMQGFKNLVNAVGGVEFDVPVNMYHNDGKTSINLKKGKQLLDGDKALQLLRYRGYSSNNSAGIDHDDYGRMQVQQMFLKEVIKQLLQPQNITKVNEFAKIAQENVQPTNIKEFTDYIYFFKEIYQMGMENISFYTLPSESIKYNGDSKTAASYYDIIKKDEALELINRTINPYTADITTDIVDWITLAN